MVAIPPRYVDAYDWSDQDRPDEGGFAPMPVEVPPWLADLTARFGYDVRLLRKEKQDRFYSSISAYHVDREITVYVHGRVQPYSVVEGLRHEVAHALVWQAHGEPGRTQWGCGPIFPQPHPIEPLVGVVEMALLERFGEREDSAELLRTLADSSAIPSFADFEEAARIMWCHGLDCPTPPPPATA